jgi:hypothetical protein
VISRYLKSDKKTIGAKTDSPSVSGKKNRRMMLKRSSSNTLSGSTLGERELRVMEILWKTPHLDARGVTGRLAGRKPSLSTVQSTLERLYRKGLAEREKQGSAYRYSALGVCAVETAV